MMKMKWFVFALMATAAALLLMLAQPDPAPAQENCDRSYPDFCISPPPPDLDCGDITRKDFTVLQPDPHRFDADKDGIGCESR